MLSMRINSILGLVILLWYTFPTELNTNVQMANRTMIETSNVAIHHYALTPRHDTIKVTRDILVQDYFQFMDSLIIQYDTITAFNLSEHLLVHANPWIIDTLTNTDYYKRIANDSFVYDQKRMIVLPESSFLVIPDSSEAQNLLERFSKTRIDINIPEYTLRIFNDTVLQHECIVRVGRHEKKFLEMSGRLQDLRTKTGVGTIVHHNRYPRYINPVTNHEYKVTKRDDGNVTKLPQIPFIETELNGLRYGQLIHPTTNPKTLGKAYSNGCIGTSEADAWIIYYNAPIGTNITICYDLEVRTQEGDPINLEDIYNRIGN